MAVNQFVPGMSVQQFYDNVQSGALSGISDSSKTAFINYLNAENANQHELEMWRLNNEYNTPENQIKRLIEAGLNPAVAYDKVTTGTASSAPGTHKSDSTQFHDTKDKLDRVNTIMNGISSIISSIGSAVGTVGGIQDIALKHQNNWYGQMRGDIFMKDGLSISNDPSKYAVPYQVAPGVYMDAATAALFPEFTKGLNSNAYNYDIKSYLAELAGNTDVRNQGIYDKQMEVNNIMNSLFRALDSPNPDFGSIVKNILKLLTIQSFRRY